MKMQLLTGADVKPPRQLPEEHMMELMQYIALCSGCTIHWGCPTYHLASVCDESSTMNSVQELRAVDLILTRGKDPDV